jgi:hypothetical protein
MARHWYVDALVRALWQDPENDIIRSEVVHTFEEAGLGQIAAEVAREMTSDPSGSLASLAPPPPPSAPTAGYVEVYDGPNGKELAVAAFAGDFDLPQGDGGLGDAGAALQEVPPPAHQGLSCDAAGGTTSALAVVFPALVFVGGMGFTAARRRRK